MFQPECDKRVSQSLKHANSQKHSLDQRSFIYLVFARSDYSTACCQSIFVPMGPITSIGHGPACPSHLPLDSLSVSPHHHPASQSKGRESKGATYQVDYQEVLLWLIRTECAHDEDC